jgi:uncharacterized membrane protein YfcA
LDRTVALVLVALLIGLAKGGLGPVAGALVTPILSTAMPVSQAVGVALPLLLLGDVFALRVYWREWDARIVKLMLPGAVVGIVMGLALLTSLPDDALRRVLGVFTLLAVGYKLASDSLARLAYTPRDWHATLAGWGSGFGSALANAGAPPITAYLLLQRPRPTVFLSTTVLFFAVINLLKLPAFLAANVVNINELGGIVWALPLIPVGIEGGRRMVRWMDPKMFERLMLALLFGAGIMLLVR